MFFASCRSCLSQSSQTAPAGDSARPTLSASDVRISLRGCTAASRKKFPALGQEKHVVLACRPERACAVDQERLGEHVLRIVRARRPSFANASPRAGQARPKNPPRQCRLDLGRRRRSSRRSTSLRVAVARQMPVLQEGNGAHGEADPKAARGRGVQLVDVHRRQAFVPRQLNALEVQPVESVQSAGVADPEEPVAGLRQGLNVAGGAFFFGSPRRVPQIPDESLSVQRWGGAASHQAQQCKPRAPTKAAARDCGAAGLGPSWLGRSGGTSVSAHPPNRPRIRLFYLKGVVYVKYLAGAGGAVCLGALEGCARWGPVPSHPMSRRWPSSPRLSTATIA